MINFYARKDWSKQIIYHDVFVHLIMKTIAFEQECVYFHDFLSRRRYIFFFK